MLWELHAETRERRHARLLARESSSGSPGADHIEIFRWLLEPQVEYFVRLVYVTQATCVCFSAYGKLRMCYGAPRFPQFVMRRELSRCQYRRAPGGAVTCSCILHGQLGIILPKDLFLLLRHAGKQLSQDGGVEQAAQPVTVQYTYINDAPSSLLLCYLFLQVPTLYRCG